MCLSVISQSILEAVDPLCFSLPCTCMRVSERKGQIKVREILHLLERQDLDSIMTMVTIHDICIFCWSGSLLDRLCKRIRKIICARLGLT